MIVVFSDHRTMSSHASSNLPDARPSLRPGETHRAAREKLLSCARLARSPWSFCLLLALAPTAFGPRFILPAAAGVVEGWIGYRTLLAGAGRRASLLRPEWAFMAAFLPFVVSSLPFKPYPPLFGSSFAWPILAALVFGGAMHGTICVLLRHWCRSFARPSADLPPL